MNILKLSSLSCCLLALLFTSIPSARAQLADSCGRPNFDRMTDRGLFLWQDCATDRWFLRATNGGEPTEFTVEGRLRLSEDIQSPAPFNLNNLGVQDIFDVSNPQNVLFRFRVFSIAQDGIDFSLAPDSDACLFFRTSDGSPVIVGRNKRELGSPLNLDTLSAGKCIVVEPMNFLLLEHD